MSNINHNNPLQFNQGSSSIFTYAPFNSSNEILDHGFLEDQMEAHRERRESNPNLMPPPPPRPQPLPPPSSNNVETAVGVSYRECHKNHATSMGLYVVDGCGEFMANGDEGTPEGIICAACECHRSFHRREMESESQSTTRMPAIHNPPPLAIATAVQPLKKRFRTKFTEEQKQKMQDFAEKLGWMIQNQDEQEILQFCNVGVSKKVFKVWMHNCKQAFRKKQDQQD
ncbi:putative transcription factor ZF-HD family [Helianthus debilis subsp. tardiflorus]